MNDRFKSFSNVLLFGNKMPAQGEAPTVEYNRLIGREDRAKIAKDGSKILSDHELNRKSFWRMTLNFGPTQTYIDPDTREEFNQPFKFIRPTENPGAYIIPGFYPQGDLVSVFTTIGAPFLGAISGFFDHSYAKQEVDELYGEIAAGGGSYYKAVFDAVVAKNEWLDKQEEKKKKEEADKKLKAAYGDNISQGRSGPTDLRGIYGDLSRLFSKPGINVTAGKGSSVYLLGEGSKLYGQPFEGFPMPTEGNQSKTKGTTLDNFIGNKLAIQPGRIASAEITTKLKFQD